MSETDSGHPEVTKLPVVHADKRLELIRRSYERWDDMDDDQRLRLTARAIAYMIWDEDGGDIEAFILHLRSIATGLPADDAAHENYLRTVLGLTGDVIHFPAGDA